MIDRAETIAKAIAECRRLYPIPSHDEGRLEYEAKEDAAMNMLIDATTAAEAVAIIQTHIRDMATRYARTSRKS